ncbi:transcriptional regulator ATRX-like isoform X2 [Ptychodera flava]
MLTEEMAKRSGIDPNPLRGKVFYLDLHNYGKASNLEKDIIELGGVIEKFLCKEVTHVITNRKEMLNVSGDAVGASTPSPAMSIPSPSAANLKSSSAKGTLDSPQMVDSPNSNDGKGKDTSVVARGKAIAQKAVTTQSKGSTDVLTNAKNWGAKIKRLEKVVEYITQYKERLGVPDAKKKTRTSKSCGKGGPSRKGRTVKTPYLKVEDSSRHYRPVVKEISQWPVVGLDTTPGACPYDGIAYDDDNGAERSEDRGNREQGEARKSQSSPSRKVRLMTAGEARKQAEARLAKKQKRGYCECCQIQYTDLELHLKSDTHQAFVSKPRNYVSLDAMVSEGPNMERFLEDVLKFHSQAKEQLDKIQEFEEDAVRLLTPPRQRVKPQRGKEKNQDAKGSSPSPAQRKISLNDTSLEIGGTVAREDPTAHLNSTPQEAHHRQTDGTGDKLARPSRDTQNSNANNVQLSHISGSGQVKQGNSSTKKAGAAGGLGNQRCKDKDIKQDCVNHEDKDSDNEGRRDQIIQSAIPSHGALDEKGGSQGSDKKRKATEESKNSSPKKKTRKEREAAREQQTQEDKDGEVSQRQVTAPKPSPSRNVAKRASGTAKGDKNRKNQTINKILSKSSGKQPKDDISKDVKKAPSRTVSSPAGGSKERQKHPGVSESNQCTDTGKQGQAGTSTSPKKIARVPSSPVKSKTRERQPSISRIFSSELSIEEFSGFTQSDIERTKNHLEELKAMMSAFDVVVLPSEPDPIEEGDSDVFVVNPEDGKAETMSYRSGVSDWDNCLSGFLERRVSTTSVRLTSLDEDSAKENRLQSSICFTESSVHKSPSKPQTCHTAVPSSGGFAVPRSVSVPRRRTVDRQDSVGRKTVERLDSVGNRTLDRLPSVGSTSKSQELDSHSRSAFEKFSESGTETSFGMSSSMLSNIREQRLLLAERQRQKALELERAKQLQKEREEERRKRLLKEWEQKLTERQSQQSTQVLKSPAKEPCSSNSKTIIPSSQSSQDHFKRPLDSTTTVVGMAKHCRTLSWPTSSGAHNILKRTVSNTETSMTREQGGSDHSHVDQLQEGALVDREIPSDSDSGRVDIADDNSRSPVFKKGIKNGKQLPSCSPTFKKGVRNAQEFAAIRETPKRKAKVPTSSPKWKASEVFSSPRRKRQSRKTSVSPRKSARKSLMNENKPLNWPVGVPYTAEDGIILEQLVLDESDHEVDFPILENSSPLKCEALMAVSPIKTVQSLRTSPGKPSPLQLRTDTNAQTSGEAVSRAKRRIFDQSPENYGHQVGYFNEHVTRSAPELKYKSQSTPRKRHGTPRKSPSKSPSTPLRGSFSPRTPKRRKCHSLPVSPSSLSPVFQYGSGQRHPTWKKPRFSMEILHPSWRKGAFTRRVTRNMFRRSATPSAMTARRNLSNTIKQFDSYSFKDTDSLASIRIK